MKKTLAGLAITIVFLALTKSGYCQFFHRMELDLGLGLWKTPTELVKYPDGFDGAKPLDLAYKPDVHLWFNVNRDIAIGLGIGMPFPAEEKNNNHVDLMFSSGLEAKYTFFTRKKFKVYGRLLYGGNINIFYTSPEYLIAQDPENPNNEIIIVNENNETQQRHQEFLMGAEAAVGCKTYFSKSFGLNTELGYAHNGVYHGGVVSLGFFFDMFKK